MVIFYAFCRTMDDLADDPGRPIAARRQSLDAWRDGLSLGFEVHDDFQREVISLRERREIPNHLLIAIIDGCRMDLTPLRFETWDDLSSYIWKVACAVGLVSIRIFGCVDPESERYAVALGHALQLTNIVRDVGEDLGNGDRIYLPLADLALFQYTERDLIDRVVDDRFLALMDYQTTRAAGFFDEAAMVLPSIDRHALLPARIMGSIYQVLLDKMRKDRFRIFEKRYQVSKARKLGILSKHLIARSTGLK